MTKQNRDAFCSASPQHPANPRRTRGGRLCKGRSVGTAQSSHSVSPSALKAAKRAERSQGESFESQKAAHMLLQELAEDGDVDRLVTSSVQGEEKKVSCFTYATELNNENEKLLQRVKDLEVCSGFSVVLLSQLVLLGHGGLFLSHASSITVHSRAQLTACHTGGIRGMQRGSHKRSSNGRDAAFPELKASQCCHRVAGKNPAVPRRAKSCLGRAWGWLE